MKYTIRNEMKLVEKYTKIPNNAFYLPAAEFKLYCWLLKHDDGFTFGKMFMVRGTVMRNVTVENTLPKLVKRKLISIDDDGNIVILKSVKNDSQK